MSNTWWGESESAEEWENQFNRHSVDLSFIECPKMVVDEIIKSQNIFKKFKSILEVGSGTGHLIGSIKSRFPELECRAFDVNKKLLNKVMDKYPDLDGCHEVDITKDIPKDWANKFDLVFTYQVLQHIRPEDISKAVNNLKKLAKKEVWCWEGIGKLDYRHGDQTSKAQNGSWVWFIDRFTECYSITVPKTDKFTFSRQRLYKIKV